MSRWFRHYPGMMRDEKLVGVAIRSKQPVERVVWIFGAILESASEINDAGRYCLDQAEVAYFLRADEADICAILDALTAAGRVAEGVVVNWGERQFQSDKSATRQAAYRERKRSAGSDGDNQQGDGQVTSPSRHRDAPETETETEKISGGGRGASTISPKAFEIATELGVICGHPSLDHWPPGWCGSPLWVQKCLNEGWLPEVMVAETRAVAMKRDGPIEHFKYLEKPLARAQAQHQAPLPKVETPQQETIRGANQTAGHRPGSVLDAAREMRRRVGGDENRNPVLSLSKG